MAFRDEWQKDKERKKLERDLKQFQQRMSTPIARGEVFQMGEMQVQHIASLALAIEALEAIFIERGTLKEDELMNRMKQLAEQKQEQVDAAAAAAAPGQQNLIQSTEV